MVSGVAAEIHCWDLQNPCTCGYPEGAAWQLHASLFIYLVAFLLETIQLPRLPLSPSFFQEVPPTSPPTKACQCFKGPEVIVPSPGSDSTG